MASLHEELGTILFLLLLITFFLHPFSFINLYSQRRISLMGPCYSAKRGWRALSKAGYTKQEQFLKRPKVYVSLRFCHLLEALIVST